MKARVLLCLAIAFGLDGLRPVAAADEPDASARRTDYVIIVTGEELLRGAYPDSHTHFLTRTLHRLGCHCVGSMTVDDRPADLKEALRFARGGWLTLVEVASSGDLGRSLSAVRGVDQLLAGGYEAPTEERMRRLLGVRDGDWSGWNPGEERVKGLAQAATKGTGSQWGLAVGGVEAGGSGAAWVWVAFGPAEGPWLSERIGLRESVEVGRANLTTQVLDWLWRRVR